MLEFNSTGTGMICWDHLCASNAETRSPALPLVVSAPTPPAAPKYNTFCFTLSDSPELKCKKIWYFSKVERLIHVHILRIIFTLYSVILVCRVGPK